VCPPIPCLDHLPPFCQYFVSDEVDEFVTAAHVPVQGGGDTVEFGGHGAHGHCFEAAAVGEADRRADDADPTQPRRSAFPPFVATAALTRRALIRGALSHRARPPPGAAAPCCHRPRVAPRSVPPGGRTLRLRCPGRPRRRSLRQCSPCL